MLNKDWGCDDECPSVMADKRKFFMRHQSAIELITTFYHGVKPNTHQYIKQVEELWGL